MNKLEELEKKIEREENLYKKVKMTIALDKIKKEIEKDEKQDR